MKRHQGRTCKGGRTYSIRETASGCCEIPRAVTLEDKGHGKDITLNPKRPLRPPSVLRIPEDLARSPDSAKEEDAHPQQREVGPEPSLETPTSPEQVGHLEKTGDAVPVCGFRAKSARRFPCGGLSYNSPGQGLVCAWNLAASVVGTTSLCVPLRTQNSPASYPKSKLGQKIR